VNLTTLARTIILLASSFAGGRRKMLLF